MADHPYNTPDLASVLKTLSALTSQANSAQPSGQSQQNVPVSQDPRVIRNNQTSQRASRPSHPSSSLKSSTPSVDPSTITTWPAALRYVMRTVGQNEELQIRIRGLIRSQHSHEQQWWNGREALLQRQRTRGDKKKELDELLRSIGAPVDPAAITTPEEDKAELTNYDAKIYQASLKMVDALMAELRGLKIPFFVLRRDLVQGAPSESQNDNPQKDSAKLTRSELTDLQRRMLELLEDLCKE